MQKCKDPVHLGPKDPSIFPIGKHHEHLINVNSKVEGFIADIQKAIGDYNELDIEFDFEGVDAAVSSGKRVLAEFDKLT